MAVVVGVLAPEVACWSIDCSWVENCWNTSASSEALDDELDEELPEVAVVVPSDWLAHQDPVPLIDIDIGD